MTELHDVDDNSDDPDDDARVEGGAVDDEYDDLPQSLYDKARDHNDQLSETERQLLLTYADPPTGLVLAYPDSLTIEDIYSTFGWPPPDVVHANIQRASNGLVTTPAELYARVRDALDRGKFDTEINDDEISLIMCHFDADKDTRDNNLGVPCFSAARKLLSRRLELDLITWKVAAERYHDLQRRRLFSHRPGWVPPPVPSIEGDRGQATRDLIIERDALLEQHKFGNVPEEDFRPRWDSFVASLDALWPKPPPHPPGSSRHGLHPTLAPGLQASVCHRALAANAIPATLSRRPVRHRPLA